MKKIYFLLFLLLPGAFLFSQQDTLLLSYTVKPGASNTDTMLIYMRSLSTNTIQVGGVDISMTFQGACADTGSGYYYSLFEERWPQTFLVRQVDLLPAPITYAGNIYTHRQLHGVVGFFQPPVTLPSNSVSPGLLVFKFVFSGSCSDVLYLENKMENPVLAISPPSFSGSIPFQVVKFNSSIFPVAFSYVQAKALSPQKVELSWQTSQEINNDYFAIEKSYSRDENAFFEVGQVKGEGFSDQPQSYSFLDESPMAPNVYYRLRQVDFDGTETYSDFVEVSFEQSPEFSAELYPNPSSGLATLEVQGLPAQAFLIQISNLSGQQLYTQSFSSSPTGFSEVDLNLAEWSPGFYLVSIQDTDTGHRVTRKLCIDR